MASSNAASRGRRRRSVRGGAILRILRRVADAFPLTPLGVFVLLGAAAAHFWLALPNLDLVWLVVTYAVAGLVAVAMLATIVGAVWLKIATLPKAHAEVERRTMETMRALPTGFAAPSLAWLPLVQVDWTWEEPQDVEVTLTKRMFGRMRERVQMRHRGRVHGVRRRIVVQDAFGLARLAIRQRDPVELTVLPHEGRLGETPLLISLAGGDERPHPMGVEDGDRVELRRYVPGDPARFIHWKVFGRTRKLMVRVPERALSPARRTVAYQVAGEDDDATAAAARVAVESRMFGPEWRFSADGADGDTDRVDEAMAMIVRSAEARERGGRGLEPFLRRVERSGPASAVVFVPARPGPWLEPVIQSARARAPRTRFVVATDGIDASPPEPWWRRLLVLPDAREGTPARELDEVVKALASSRAEVIVLDRKSGRRLGDRHRRAMRKRESARAEKQEAA